MKGPSYLHFDKKGYPWKPDIDYRDNPELYKVGKGEQGVLICQPYKDEIGKYWRFKDEATARRSSEQIFALFLNYLDTKDFVGADMARKYLQMGYTRARRYANYRGGKKYDKENNYELLERGTGEVEKAHAAEIFYKVWKDAESDPRYALMKKAWKLKYG
ncbi:DUF4385 domain-containing protein [Flavobacterium sp. DG1-102-2]|uniref:DUF4385 domain-containing protein n=1 Tax=Flavobacterium sp. DG1-102-2 TaxID=3081663 RepID=UPI002948FF5B|nr:DUF4385 domain-containing protein [Flavobacterium sp. DG1-102-2]MDV6167129.1 DUF4385 domain-containing protein [Flavobacterium sp. DG1-102-2]